MGPGQERLAALSARAGAQTFPTHHEGEKILELGGKIRHYKSDIPSLGPLRLADLQQFLWRIDRASSKVSSEHPLATAGAARLDSLSVEAWARRNIATESVRDLLAVASRVIFGAELAEVSMLYFLFYLRVGGGLMNLVEIDNGAQQTRFANGTQALAQFMAEQLTTRLPESLHLDAAVSRVAQDGSGITVETARGELRCRRAIVSVPPNLVSRIDFDPALPGAREQLVERLPMGATIKIIATYDRTFWRERGFSGEVASAEGPFSAIFDNTSMDQAQPALVGFVVGQAAREFSLLSEVERRRAALSALGRYFGADAAKAEEVVIHDWLAEKYSGGCPVGVAAAGVMSTSPSSLREPVGRVHWAGTETATVFTGYLEGALHSGERAAEEVSRLL